MSDLTRAAADVRAAAETQQQAAVAALAPAYIPACPGAGKTHVITTRHLQSPARSLRKGRALISFTRVARDQMASRCRRAGRGDLVQAPHFIGTLDSFLWEFLVKPLRKAEPACRLLESWAGVKATVQLDRAIPLHQFPLTLDPDPDLPIKQMEAVAWDRVDYNTARILEDSPFSRIDWLDKIIETREPWLEQGYCTGHETRMLALWCLRSSRASRILPPLLSRFAEVIVDEAQDCSAADLAILELLHQAGLPLVLVGDPDQAIYAWRGAEPQALQQLAAQLTGTPVPLTGNWRSSPVICRLAATLRSGQRAPDTPVVSAEEIPVGILPTRFAARGSNHHHAPTDESVVDVFHSLAREYGIDSPDCLVTAHKYATLPGITREKSNTSPITSLAWARTVAHTATASSGDLVRACTVAVRTLLSYWFPDETGGTDRICAAHDLSASQINRTAFAFLHSLPAPHKGWAQDVWQAMKAWPAPASAAPQNTRGRLAGHPVVTKAAVTTGLWTNSVYQVKGDQADAVLLMLPDTGSIQRWATGDPATDEVLRIWYVAVTRARRLVALAVHEDETEALTRLLDRHEIRTRLV
ncbi:UvrD-helicase domain-containing protein [Streptomyces avermitilis]|uniref:UvrD-helicase domain-containing protein n=1 Tax=Streptomyces avermitilis TaxID=33903 RepID=UPI0033B5ACA7